MTTKKVFVDSDPMLVDADPSNPGFVAPVRTSSGGSVSPTYKSGDYISVSARYPGSNGAAITKGEFQAFRFRVEGSVTLDQVSIGLHGNGDAGSKVRFGLWSDVAGRPKGILLDSGDLAADSGAPVAIAYALSPHLTLNPGFYWFGYWWGPSGIVNGPDFVLDGVFGGNPYTDMPIVPGSGNGQGGGQPATGSGAVLDANAPAGYGAAAALPDDPDAALGGLLFESGKNAIFPYLRVV